MDVWIQQSRHQSLQSVATVESMRLRHLLHRLLPVPLPRSQLTR
jgi:hypothetical protein